jgi:tripartite-type tricarboxylate transporter receptor subunit TctC
LQDFAHAQNPASYPNKSINLEIPFAPGGNLDIIGRTLAPGLSKILGQSVVVENRAGAGGAIAGAFVAKSAPDGYTLIVATTNTIGTLPHLIKTNYQLENFAPISAVAFSPLMIVVRKNDTRFNSAKDLIAMARQNPSKVSVGHSGPGTSNHMSILNMEDAAKLQFNVIPYKGSAPALTDLIGGQLDFVVDQITSSKPFIDGGQLKILAVLARNRDANFPDVPTLVEQTQIDLEMGTTTGILAPSGTPADVIQKLNAAIGQVTKEEEFLKRMKSIGSTPLHSTPSAWQEMIAKESASSKKLAQSGKIKAE